MKDLKLSIELLPKGAWNNDFSKTLPKKEWDIVREFCYKKANHRCQICGFETDDLDAHEVWEFDIKNKTQTLKNIIGICSKCHGVKHIRNSKRLGHEEDAKKHFIKVNNCSELEYAAALAQAQLKFDELNKVYRWKIIADLEKYGLKNPTIKERNIPFIINPYEGIDWYSLSSLDAKKLVKTIKKLDSIIGAPKINFIDVDNYQGDITVSALFANKVEWYLDEIKIKTKYNVVGNFTTTFNVANLLGKSLYFRLFGDYGITTSKTFELMPQGVI